MRPVPKAGSRCAVFNAPCPLRQRQAPAASTTSSQRIELRPDRLLMHPERRGERFFRRSASRAAGHVGQHHGTSSHQSRCRPGRSFCSTTPLGVLAAARSLRSGRFSSSGCRRFPRVRSGHGKGGVKLAPAPAPRSGPVPVVGRSSSHRPHCPPVVQRGGAQRSGRGGTNADPSPPRRRMPHRTARQARGTPSVQREEIPRQAGPGKHSA